MKMRKRAAVFLLTIFALFMLCGFSGTFTRGSANYVYDEAHLFTEAEIAELNAYIESVRDSAKSDFVVATSASPSISDPIDASEAIAKSWVAAGNGYGEDHQVIVFYIDMENRTYYLNEYNDNENYKLSESEIDEITYEIEGYLKNGYYSTAAGKAIELSADAAKPGFFQRIWGWLTAGLVGGGAASGIAMGTHNTRTATPVRHYMVGQRVSTGRREDVFTHTTTIVQPKQTQQNRPGSSGGGGHISAGPGHSSGNHGGGGHF